MMKPTTNARTRFVTPEENQQFCIAAIDKITSAKTFNLDFNGRIMLWKTKAEAERQITCFGATCGWNSPIPKNFIWEALPLSEIDETTLCLHGMSRMMLHAALAFG